MILAAKGEYKKAEDAFVSETATAPNDLSLHAAHLRNLLDKGDVQEGTRLADAFAAEKPDSAIAQVAEADALLRGGKLPEAYALAAKAQKADPCYARAYQVLATYEDMIAMYATAKRHIDLAHALDPQDIEVTEQWIEAQPRASRNKLWLSFVETAPIYTEKEREQARARLEKAAANAANQQCRLASSVTETTVPFSAIRFDPDSDPAFGLEMSFNGKKRRLELDTGASGLTITNGAAQRLGLRVEDRAIVGGVGDEGGRVSKVAYVDELKIGDLQFANCQVFVLPPNDRANPLYDVDGLIGGDIFRQYLLTLDYPAGELRLSPLPKRPGEAATDTTLATSEDGGKSGTSNTGTAAALDRYRSPEMQTWTPVYRVGHEILLPTQLNDGPVKLLMVDTGAGMNLISPKAARLVTKVASTGRYGISGLSGEAKNVYLTDKIVLHFANLFLPLPWMESTDTDSISNSTGVEVSGFLGFPALRQMTVAIDYRDNLIHFDFDPKRKPNPKFARTNQN